MMLLFFVAPAYSAQNIRIEIPEVVYAKNNTLTLGQAAKISGGNTRTRRVLAAIRLYPDGSILTRQEVLRAIGDSDASDARIELYMPTSVRVEAPGYEGNLTESSVSESRPASSLVPLIKSLSAWDGEVEVSASAPVPEGRLIDPASIVPGTSAVTLRFRDNAGKIRPLAVRLTWIQNVMVASHNIKKGDRLNAQDMMTRPMKITKPGLYASSPNEIIGFTANKNIKQGEAIALSSLTSSSVVKKGRRVRIVARIGGATASTEGILLEDGRPGEYVRVRRADDRHVTLRARIVNENLVEVQVE